MGQNCLGRWSPTILSVRSRSRTPSPPASSTAQKCRGNGGIGTDMFDKLIILPVPPEPGAHREKVWDQQPLFVHRLWSAHSQQLAAAWHCSSVNGRIGRAPRDRRVSIPSFRIL